MGSKREKKEVKEGGREKGMRSRVSEEREGRENVGGIETQDGRKGQKKVLYLNNRKQEVVESSEEAFVYKQLDA